MTLPLDSQVAVEVQHFGLRRHGRHLTLPVLGLIALAAASGFWVGALPEAWMNWAAGIGAAVLAVLIGVGPILDWLTTRTTVTSRRVIQRHGLFVHERTEIPLSRVRGVRSVRGPVQRLFGSGDIELLVGADAPTVIRDVPGCVAVVDALQELIEQNFTAAGPEHGAPGASQVAGGSGPRFGSVPGGIPTPSPGYPEETRALPGF